MLSRLKLTNLSLTSTHSPIHKANKILKLEVELNVKQTLTRNKKVKEEKKEILTV